MLKVLTSRELYILLFNLIFSVGLGGKTELDQARVDMIIDCFDDMVKPLFGIFTAKSDEEKVEIRRYVTEVEICNIKAGKKSFSHLSRSEFYCCRKSLM